MRVITHGRFNLCPAPMCNPEGGTKSAEFSPYREVPEKAVAWGERIVEAGRLDVAGIEYLEARDGRLVFYDINANSNLRPSVASAFGFDPFERVVDFLAGEMRAYEGFLRFSGLRGRIEV